MTEETAVAHAPIDAASPWLSELSYWYPPKYVQSGWLEHAPFAYWLMGAARPSTVVELGTHNGYSFFTFCEAAVRLGLDSRCYAIDTWQGDDHASFYGEEVFRDVSATAEQDYPAQAVLLRGYFDDYVDTFDDGSIDLLHIDGRHGYDDVKHDFESWLPKVADGGIVLFHDVAVHDRDFGVWKFWDELAAQHPSFAFEHGNGLGVLSVGERPNAAIAPLVTASAEEATRVREFYARQGAQMTWIESMKPQVRELAAIVASPSWRVTRPLRAVAERIPAGTRRRIRAILPGG